jgi:hypothetical protein
MLINICMHACPILWDMRKKWLCLIFWDGWSILIRNCKSIDRSAGKFSTVSNNHSSIGCISNGLNMISYEYGNFFFLTREYGRFGYRCSIGCLTDESNNGCSTGLLASFFLKKK